MSYFSDRETGERPRDRDEIDEGVWSGIRAIIRARIDDGSFGAAYPDVCIDGRGPVGTDENAFWQVMRSEIPNLGEKPWHPAAGVPSALEVLDTVEFCWRTIGRPTQGSYHSYFGHYHLTFDIEAGRTEFRKAVNRIFRRNGLVYELGDDGQIVRLAPPVLRPVEIQDSIASLFVIQARNGTLCTDGRPMGEDGAALPGQAF